MQDERSLSTGLMTRSGPSSGASMGMLEGLLACEVA